MMIASFKLRVGLLLGLSVAAIGGMLLVPPFAQPLWYHDFADQRCFCGIPHTLNVVSNLPFLLIGLAGMWYLLRPAARTRFIDPSERWLYFGFFLFISLTGIGSAYYHSDPNNDTLLWDRLPLAMAFMALFAIILGERIGRRVGIWLFHPLVALGAASVVY